VEIKDSAHCSKWLFQRGQKDCFGFVFGWCSRQLAVQGLKPNDELWHSLVLFLPGGVELPDQFPLLNLSVKKPEEFGLQGIECGKAAR
jgi:hypothetical protein